MKPDTAAIDALVYAINSLQRAIGITAIVVAACLALSLLICTTILARAIEGRCRCTPSSAKSSTESDTATGATIPNGHHGSGSATCPTSTAPAHNADDSTAGSHPEMQTTQ